MKRHALLIVAILAGFFAASCSSPVAPGGSSAQVTNIYTYIEASDPVVGARFATYPVSLALVDANTNVLYEFLLINLANAPYQLVPAGSYFPAYRAWTNTAGGILTNTPWVVTNAITLSNFTSNVLTLITAATTTNDFCANAALTSITVTAP